ncbi:hypothetical protein T5.134 [Escherichia phage T5]|uniref:Uncharacterized protein n=1 Tax=Escherichia phage T5 TaxID=2695836 RepID=Q6QGF3_BPT5|nr:hypothetical protein T5.134 [Escherichia phage T5]pir/S01983/ hypothetical protein 123 - phage T5 [Escherichia phage T5]AAS77203.1 hypothetical protein T5.134 [Escherichia phage T5]
MIASRDCFVDRVFSSIFICRAVFRNNRMFIPFVIADETIFERIKPKTFHDLNCTLHGQTAVFANIIHVSLLLPRPKPNLLRNSFGRFGFRIAHGSNIVLQSSIGGVNCTIYGVNLLNPTRSPA